MTSVLEYRGEHVAHGTLTVSAAHMNGFKSGLGVAQQFAKPANIGEVFLISSTAQVGEHGQCCI